MEQTDRPIGVFDSGVGGISVLRELVRLMPQENYIFYGDSRNAPYGSKTLEEVRFLTEEKVVYLLEQDVKAVVIACNTATSADVSILRRRYPHIPIIGIEPALKPAVLSAAHPKVLVMATPMTIREEKFRCLLEQYQEQAKIYPLACPGIVEFVERGELTGTRLRSLLEKLLAPYLDKEIDAVVLGCTHYPFIREAIAEILPGEVRFYDGGPGVARETRRRLDDMGMRKTGPGKGQVLFESSLEDGGQLELCRRLLNSK